MNSLIISFVVGGILLLSILAFNQMVMDNQKEMTLGATTQENLNNVVELITNDFNKIGYRAPSTPISRLDSTDFIFIADLYDDDTYGAQQVRWFWDKSNAHTLSSNPNDYMLERTGPVSSTAQGTVEIPVTYFKVRYLDANSVQTSNPTLVRRVEVEVIVEAPEPHRYDSDGNGVFYRSAWKRTFVPNNINLPY